MFVKPEDVIESLNVYAGMKVADFGCGAGYYTIPLAKRVGERGKIYALDIRKEMLELVESSARLERLLNVETMWSDLETEQGSHLADDSVDLVIISNILFQVEDRVAVAAEAHRILRPEGFAAVIEWEKEKGLTGPPKEQRISKEQAKQLFLEHGFVSQKEFYVGEQHYGILFKKRVESSK